MTDSVAGRESRLSEVACELLNGVVEGAVSSLMGLEGRTRPPAADVDHDRTETSAPRVGSRNGAARRRSRGSLTGSSNNSSRHSSNRSTATPVTCASSAPRSRSHRAYGRPSSGQSTPWPRASRTGTVESTTSTSRSSMSRTVSRMSTRAPSSPATSTQCVWEAQGSTRSTTGTAKEMVRSQR